MPAVMRILGWKAEGLRCPDHEIDCCNAHGEPHGVTLIQMPNGTGKTTALSLLRAGLSGAALTWDRARIMPYQKKGNGNTEGRFEIRLMLNDRRVTIIMYFDFENGRVHYKTTRGQGQVDGFSPPVEFRRFMTDNFVGFFVFDGELANHLLDKEHTHAEAVIESLFQINTLRSMEQRVQEYWESKTQKVTATEDRGLSRRSNKLINLRARLRVLEEDKKRDLARKADITTRLKTQQDTYDQEIKKEEARSDALSAAELKASGLGATVREAALEVLDTMRDPHALSPCFARVMSDLKNGLDRVKLPESAAREFFEELATEDECVCGRKINAEIRDVIRNRAADYLGSDDVSLLNSMKTAIQEAVGQDPEGPEGVLSDKIEALDAAVDEERTAQLELDQLRHEAEQSDPAVKRAKEAIEQLQAELYDVDERLERFDSRDESQSDENTFGIEIIRKRIAEAERKLDEINQTFELKAKRDILMGILQAAYRKARIGITKEISAQANQRMRELMPHNNISISGIEQCLLLEGQEGGSVGETLSVAYAFLATLFDRSAHQLPFVVDSPAGAIDLGVRPKIGALIPRLSDQFIAFTISSERDKFVQPLKKASDSQVKFLTLFRKGSSQYEMAARATGGCIETADGFLVQGESFFNDFQLDTEEAL